MKKKTLSATMVACFLAINMVAQNHACISIKVTNVPTPTGKVLLLTDKGQQAMVEAKGNEAIIEMGKLPIGTYQFNIIHDTNGNWTLDMDKNHIPTESCASVKVEIKEDTQLVTIELKDYQQRTTP